LHTRRSAFHAQSYTHDDWGYLYRFQRHPRQVRFYPRWVTLDDFHSIVAEAFSVSLRAAYFGLIWTFPQRSEAAPYYNDRERAALEWTEAVTVLTNGHAPDSIYERVRAQFGESEIAALTLAIAMINSWNRLNVALRTEAGGYRPGMFKGLHA
jgi:hypothetical protein